MLGGTRFVGRAITQACLFAGHDVLVVHRGLHEPTDIPEVEHLHLERASWPGHAAEFAAFRPDAAIDVSAGDGDGARSALAALPPDIKLVALSSVDVYRAYEGLHSGMQTDAVPLLETSALRSARYIDGPQWENLDIEEAYLQAGAAVLRLGAVYGEHDYQHRFEAVLRRIRAHRSWMPVGTGGFLFSRVYVGDVAQAVLGSMSTGRTAGECFNIVEEQTAPMRLFYDQVIAASRSKLELVGVADRALPPDLRASGTMVQHMLASGYKARQFFGWRPTNPGDNLRRSVRWHLENPKTEWDQDFSADDSALGNR